MCLIVFAYRAHPDFPLIVLGNRDEFYARPTRAAHFWADQPQVFAGRDLESPETSKQGTWMGINKQGRFAAVTNFREMDFNETGGKRSRGELTANFLCSGTALDAYLRTVEKNRENYKGFNLLLWENNILCYVSNRIDQSQILAPGIYGLSNGMLDDAWPKVRYAKQQLQTALEQQAFNTESLLDILLNTEQATDDRLPNTGIDIESERLLSSCFISGEHYGTRASTCVLINKHQHITFLEKNWEPKNAKSAAVQQRFLQFTFADQKN